MSAIVAFSSRRPGTIARALGHAYLRIAGWRVEGELPVDGKMVIIAAPHTSNWDLPHMLAVSYVLGVWPAWMGKRELFRWPFGAFFRFLGGLEVDRSKRTNLVEQAVALFARAERLHLVVPPSGTRSRVTQWRSGFYYIARGAGVPIACTFLDYRRKVGGVGPIFTPSSDVKADMDMIRGFYAGVTGRYPERMSEPRLREEGEKEPRFGSAS